MNKYTKTKAIRIAQTEVGELRKFGNAYIYRSFDNGCNAWRESVPMDYYRALSNRSECLIRHARELLGKEDVFIPYDGGNWQSYV